MSNKYTTIEIGICKLGCIRQQLFISLPVPKLCLRTHLSVKPCVTQSRSGLRRKSVTSLPVPEHADRWLRSLQATSGVQKEAPEVRFVSAGDREADIYELFELAEQLDSSFLVRSFHNRKVSDETKVWDLVGKEESAGRMKG